ncbi:energy transducer TonB [Rhodohalobacter barkolensis]|uniref:TonB C-terminal domain-containing protein n=1 Tax=Rhodohalobacter barkolensis TaxID=2053187 RepID=A0A2N0VLK4_9BACT|nr:energy transducer TonB [Rhodohalobacter barkolensis]PKD45034.1 hypothetical protein CWD77_06145 [Rhodohalobacter barkolensis]
MAIPRNITCAIFTVISFLLIVLIFSSCSSSEKLTDGNLDHLNLNVESPQSNDDNYVVQIEGFQDDGGEDYKSVLQRLERHEWDDIVSVDDSSSTEEKNIQVEILNRPESLNRVLWQISMEHYRNHAVDYTPDHQDGESLIMSEMPELIGSFNELQKKVHYPSHMEGTGIEGRVDLVYVINEFGEVTDPEVVGGVHQSLNREAIRVIQLAKYKPGMMNGLPVKVKMNAPIFIRE